MNDKLISYENLTEDEIDRMLQEQIPFTQKNAENIERKVRRSVRALHRRRVLRRAGTAAAVFAVLCISTVTYAKTFGFPNVYRILFGDNADDITPYVNHYDPKTTSVCVQNGMEVKALSAIRDDKEQLTFFTVTDKEGNRLSKKTEASEFHHSDYDNISIAECPRLIDYDEATKTATFLYHQVGLDMNNDTTLTIDQFANPVRHKNKMSAISLYDLLTEQPGGERKSYRGVETFSDVYPTEKMLETNKINLELVEGSEQFLSNAGFIDGALHIQINPLRSYFDTHYRGLMDISILDAKGKRISNVYKMNETTFYDSFNNDPERYSKYYNEIVFQNITDKEQLKGCKLRITYYTVENITDGPWKITFSSPKRLPKISRDIKGRLSLDGQKFSDTRVLLTPLGAAIETSAIDMNTPEYDDRVELKYTDGTSVKLSKTMVFSNGDQTKSIHNFKAENGALDLDKLKQLIVNKKVIDLQ